MITIGQYGTGAHHWLWNGGTDIQFGVWNGAILRNGQGITIQTSPVWFTATWNGNTEYKFYVNNVLIASVQKNFDFNIKDNNIRIGKSPPGWNEADFSGKISEVLIFRHACTAQEISNFVSSGGYFYRKHDTTSLI